jgi:hypothetical protein
MMNGPPGLQEWTMTTTMNDLLGLQEWTMMNPLMTMILKFLKILLMMIQVIPTIVIQMSMMMIPISAISVAAQSQAGTTIKQYRPRACRAARA